MYMKYIIFCQHVGSVHFSKYSGIEEYYRMETDIFSSKKFRM